MPWADLKRLATTEARWNKRLKRPDWFTKIKAYNKPLSRNFRSNWAGYWLTVCNPPYIDLLDIIQTKRSRWNFTLLERIQEWSHTSLSGTACERSWNEIAHMEWNCAYGQRSNPQACQNILMVTRDEQATDAVHWYMWSLQRFPDYEPSYRPRSKVGSDIFEWIKEHYLVIVDYYAHVIALPQG